ncbi:MAG TPA: hypothetical protein VFG19_03715 [Geobacteraceae bacterium]|nr:hypothetical protein [Geobacteraceae bacterium]
MAGIFTFDKAGMPADIHVPAVEVRRAAQLHGGPSGHLIYREENW